MGAKEEQIERIFEHFGVSMLGLHSETGVFYPFKCNALLSRMLGEKANAASYSVDLIAGIVYGEDKPGFLREIELLKNEDKNSARCEFRAADTQGNIVFIQMIIIGPDRPLGQCNYSHLCFFSDITSTIDLERSLPQSKVGFEYLSENTSDGIKIFVKEKSDYMSPNYYKMMGIDPKTSPRMTEAETMGLIHPEDRDEIKEIVQKGIEQKKRDLRYSYRARHGDGHYFWKEDVVRLIYNDKGEYYAAYVVARDISIQKNLELELKAALEKLREVEEIQRNLLLNLSHELRTPLHGIMGYATMASDNADNASGKSYSERILQSCERLQDTVDNLVVFSRANTMREREQYKTMPLIDTLQEVISEFELKCKQKSIEFRTDFSSVSSGIRCSAKLVAVAIKQLLDNAFKYTDDGIVNLIARTITSDGRLWNEVEIADTGIGIPADKQEKIFTAFYQISAGYAREYEGLGLGLSIAKQAISQLDGDIQLIRSDSTGSSFAVRIPAVQMAEDIKIENKQLSSGGGEIKKPAPVVLSVEDNVINQEIIDLFLSDFCRIDQAKNGEEALEAAKENKYDLILMDINLGPGINGIDVAKMLRKEKKYERIPIIAVTGYDLEMADTEVKEAEITSILKKPFNHQQLRTAVIEALKQNHP